MRFSYVKYDEISQKKQAELKAAYEAVEKLIEDLAHGRAKALCLTHLEESYMWTGKSIRDTQLERNKETQEQPERCND